MSLWKIRSKCSPTNFLLKLLHNIFRGKSCLKLFASSKFFKKLPKENNQPISKISPNLVTLFVNTTNMIPTRFKKTLQTDRNNFRQCLKCAYIGRPSKCRKTNVSPNIILEFSTPAQSKQSLNMVTLVRNLCWIMECRYRTTRKRLGGKTFLTFDILPVLSGLKVHTELCKPWTWREQTFKQQKISMSNQFNSRPPHFTYKTLANNFRCNLAKQSSQSKDVKGNDSA
jgi:hypothetical protein